MQNVTNEKNYPHRKLNISERHKRSVKEQQNACENCNDFTKSDEGTKNDESSPTAYEPIFFFERLCQIINYDDHWPKVFIILK